MGLLEVTFTSIWINLTNLGNFEGDNYDKSIGRDNLLHWLCSAFGVLNILPTSTLASSDFCMMLQQVVTSPKLNYWNIMLCMWFLLDSPPPYFLDSSVTKGSPNAND